MGTVMARVMGRVMARVAGCKRAPHVFHTGSTQAPYGQGHGRCSSACPPLFLDSAFPPHFLLRMSSARPPHVLRISLEFPQRFLRVSSTFILQYKLYMFAHAQLEFYFWPRSFRSGVFASKLNVCQWNGRWSLDFFSRNAFCKVLALAPG